jgi:hypothetical protein
MKEDKEEQHVVIHFWSKEEHEAVDKWLRGPNPFGVLIGGIGFIILAVLCGFFSDLLPKEKTVLTTGGKILVGLEICFFVMVVIFVAVNCDWSK